MRYVYSFDPMRTHTLDFKIIVEQYLEKANGVIEMFVTGVVTEIKDNKVLHKESKSRTFSFKNKTDKQKEHDLNINRIRYSNEKKWILNIVNNESITETLDVGIISDTAHLNPLFLDIYSEDKVYSYFIKGNNISILEKNYVAPILEQTVISYRFDEPGVPENFTVGTSRFNSAMKAIELDKFDYIMPYDIPQNTSFTVEMNIVPKKIETGLDGSLFKVQLDGLGEIVVYPKLMTFLKTGSPLENIESVNFTNEITSISQLYGQIYKKESKLQIIGNGKGGMTIIYMDQGLSTTYSTETAYNTLRFSGSELNQIIGGSGEVNLSVNNIDNLTIKYKK